MISNQALFRVIRVVAGTIYKIEPPHETFTNVVCATSKGSDQLRMRVV